MRSHSSIAAETLFKNTHLGRGVPEFSRSDLREVLFRGYRIVYLLQNDEVSILLVVHGARDLPALVNREPWDISSWELSPFRGAWPSGFLIIRRKQDYAETVRSH